MYRKFFLGGVLDVKVHMTSDDFVWACASVYGPNVQ